MYRCENLPSLIIAQDIDKHLSHFLSRRCSCAGTDLASGKILLAYRWAFQELSAIWKLDCQPLVQTSHCCLWILDCGQPLTPQQVGVGNCFVLPCSPQLSSLVLCIPCFKHIYIFLNSGIVCSVLPKLSHQRFIMFFSS